MPAETNIVHYSISTSVSPHRSTLLQITIYYKTIINIAPMIHGSMDVANNPNFHLHQLPCRSTLHLLVPHARVLSWRSDGGGLWGIHSWQRLCYINILSFFTGASISVECSVPWPVGKATKTNPNPVYALPRWVLPPGQKNVDDGQVTTYWLSLMMLEVE